VKKATSRTVEEMRRARTEALTAILSDARAMVEFYYDEGVGVMLDPAVPKFRNGVEVAKWLDRWRARGHWTFAMPEVGIQQRAFVAGVMSVKS